MSYGRQNECFLLPEFVKLKFPPVFGFPNKEIHTWRSLGLLILNNSISLMCNFRRSHLKRPHYFPAAPWTSIYRVISIGGDLRSKWCVEFLSGHRRTGNGPLVSWCWQSSFSKGRKAFLLISMCTNLAEPSQEAAAGFECKQGKHTSLCSFLPPSIWSELKAFVHLTV